MLTIDRLTLQLPYYPRWWRREWTTCIESLSLHLQPGEEVTASVRAVAFESSAGVESMTPGGVVTTKDG